jgi:CubicO group peptidase (beta-lactamase class C family)
MVSPASLAYVPPPESAGGWRTLATPEVADLAGMDPARLDALGERQQLFNAGDSWSIVIVRRGYLVREFHTFNVLGPTRFDIWSCTKSFTSTAFGLAFEDGRRGSARTPLALDSKAYDLIPEGHPISDPGKAEISLAHLLTMTAGLPGESVGVVGMPTQTGVGPFEHALGFADNRYGRTVARLVADPGARWDYSDASMAHLALVFRHATGSELAESMAQRLFSPIGIEELSWDVQGGSGALGPHTNAHTGVHVSARELARFGYLFLRGGDWAGQQIVPRWWVELATRTSQALNADYGYLWWVNTAGTKWPSLPRDAFAAIGYRSNRCYVIPSLDLVVARVGTGPVAWDEQELIGSIVAAVVEESQGR